MLSKPKGVTSRIIAVSLIFFFMTSFAFPKESLAYRSRDGGGEIAEFDFGKWAAGTAIGLVSSGIGSALASGITSGIGSALGNASGGTGYPSFMDSVVDSLSSLKGVDSWATNFVNSTAVGQTQNAIGMMGNYYGWDPGSTILLSSIAGGVVGGGLAPGHFGSSLGSGVGVSQSFNGSLNALSGMGIGLVEGTIEGAILMSSMRSEHGKGYVDPIMGNIANLAGSLATGALVGGLTKANEFSFANIGDFNFSRAGQDVVGAALRSIPSAGISMGVQSLTSGNMDTQDSYIIKNAFSGLYYMVNMPTNFMVSEKVMRPLFEGSSRESSFRNTAIQSTFPDKVSSQNSNTLPAQNYYSVSAPILGPYDRR
ncbi:MAG: hypothetical protein PHJ00_02495 [Candidatus Omnitrophica bacterium]|nr:hypothetical protein [Candidatus Omnitrophota bacterium]